MINRRNQAFNRPVEVDAVFYNEYDDHRPNIRIIGTYISDLEKVVDEAREFVEWWYERGVYDGEVDGRVHRLRNRLNVLRLIYGPDEKKVGK